MNPMGIILASIIVGLLFPLQAFSQSSGLFQEKVQPLLAAKCLACHGPEKQMGSLRLDKKSFAMKGGFNGPIAEPGKPEESLIIKKVLGTAEGERMPMGMEPLQEEEIDWLKQWIAQGMKWPPDKTANKSPVSSHWAFQPRKNVQPPQVENEGWVQNPIDRFVLRKLEKEELEPSPLASRETLLRRLYLDITGLLPKPEDLEAFLNDDSPNAYEKVVDRLLASPHFGERWGRYWLDAARYADSDGYEKDLPRPYAWRYRDWMIEAINEDMPFDQFTIEQLAGDLLPNPTLDQLTATGFHRNTLTNREGGVDQEEFRVKAVKDRTNTTGQVWLGLTVACAECHNHKYDPISQKEYYGLYAFFNKARKKNYSAPFEDELKRYQRKKIPYDSVHNRLVDAFEAFQEEQFPERLQNWLNKAQAPPEVWKELQPATLASEVKDVSFSLLEDHSILTGGKNPYDNTYTLEFYTNAQGITAFQLETLPHNSFKRGGAGRSDEGDFVISEFKVNINGEPVALKGASADYEDKQGKADFVLDASSGTGWSVENNGHRPHRLVVQTEAPIGDGEETKITIILEQNRGLAHTLGRFRLFTTTYDKDPVEARDISVRTARALRAPKSERSAEDKQLLAQFYAQRDSVYQELKQAVDKHKETEPPYPDTYVRTMEKNPDPPITRLMERGDFLRPKEKVKPHVPSVLPAIRGRNGEPDRLDLARWLVSPENPLTSRVAANRVWQNLFGTGLVETPEDFGTRGEPPTHPKLLDWLAGEYIRLDWSRKALIKLIVMSNTYRQSSATRPELADVDPENKLLARQNRFRLQAEILRDIALQAGGLLNRKIGGPSIRPPLPADVVDLGYANSLKWPVSKGEEKYRRGIYIFFQRTVPYPMLMTFDCPDSNVSVVRRSRSNTPLQALTLLNDPVFFESAQHLGYRIIQEGPQDTVDRIRYAFRVCLSRNPSRDELQRLSRLFNSFYQTNLTNTDDIDALLPDDPPSQASQIEATSWIALARTLMNLEEFMTRE